ncbi:MAG: hypothetical protein AB1778_06735 [Candidatus Bipolaricaulota bacterium]
MNKRMKGFMVGITVVSLLATGVVALAAGWGGRGAGQQAAGTCTSATCGGDCVRALAGSGGGAGQGYGQGLSPTRPLDGTGYRGGTGAGRGMGRGAASCGGSCS